MQEQNIYVAIDFLATQAEQVNNKANLHNTNTKDG